MIIAIGSLQRDYLVPLKLGGLYVVFGLSREASGVFLKVFLPVV